MHDGPMNDFPKLTQDSQVERTIHPIGQSENFCSEGRQAQAHELTSFPTIAGRSDGSHSQLPTLIAQSGPAAQFAWEEFIFGKIRNPHTRLAYERAIRKFLRHAELQNRQLIQITPSDVGRYLDGLDYAAATKKQHLAALRHFFDTLVSRHVVVLNPAASVRSERLQVIEGRTPEITLHQVRTLLASLDTSHVVGLRDQAIIGILLYTAARVGSSRQAASRRLLRLWAISIAFVLARKAASRARSPFVTISASSYLPTCMPADLITLTRIRHYFARQFVGHDD